MKSLSRLIIFVLICLSACESKNEFSQTSFYYWKTQYKISDYEKNYLNALNVRNIYFRAFDVVDQEPVGVLHWKETIDNSLHYIPVVFIDHEVFRHVDKTSNSKLAKNVFRLLKGICKHQNILFQEIQIDCDWTKGTKDGYFYFLKQLKNESQKIISTTIRLHQIKFKNSTGVPPCDYGILMCYNMGNMKSRDASNSIYDPEILNRYLKRASYPLDLKVALPIFSWMLWYREERFLGILDRTSNVTGISKVCVPYKNGFRFKVDTIIGSHNFEKGDYVRDERVSSNDIIRIKDYLSRTNLNLSDEIIYFSLDSTNLVRYEESILAP